MPVNVNYPLLKDISLILGSGPPYNDQTLIQKFITSELEKEEPWHATQHIKPMQVELTE